MRLDGLKRLEGCVMQGLIANKALTFLGFCQILENKHEDGEKKRTQLHRELIDGYRPLKNPDEKVLMIMNRLPTISSNQSNRFTLEIILQYTFYSLSNLIDFLQSKS